MEAVTDERGGCVPMLRVHEFGPVTSSEREHAEVTVSRMLAHAPVAVRTARIDLRVEPEWLRPALVRLTVGHDGHTVRAHADSAASLDEAVDVAALRLRRRLDDLARP